MAGMSLNINSLALNPLADKHLTFIIGGNRTAPNHNSNPMQANVHQRWEQDSSQEKTVVMVDSLQADKHPTSCMEKYKTSVLLLMVQLSPSDSTLAKLLWPVSLLPLCLGSCLYQTALAKLLLPVPNRILSLCLTFSKRFLALVESRECFHILQTTRG